MSDTLRLPTVNGSVIGCMAIGISLVENTDLLCSELGADSENRNSVNGMLFGFAIVILDPDSEPLGEDKPGNV